MFESNTAGRCFVLDAVARMTPSGWSLTQNNENGFDNRNLWRLRRAKAAELWAWIR